MIYRQHWFDFDRIIITDEANNASVQLEIFRKDDKVRHEHYKADCLLYALWVNERYREDGAARKLMGKALLMAKELGCKCVALEYDCREAPEWVREWYERIGFEEKEFGRFESLMVKQLSKKE